MLARCSLHAQHRANSFKQCPAGYSADGGGQVADFIPMSVERAAHNPRSSFAGIGRDPGPQNLELRAYRGNPIAVIVYLWFIYNTAKKGDARVY